MRRRHTEQAVAARCSARWGMRWAARAAPHVLVTDDGATAQTKRAALKLAGSATLADTQEEQGICRTAASRQHESLASF
jgi:protein subunit release factor B